MAVEPHDIVVTYALFLLFNLSTGKILTQPDNKIATVGAAEVTFDCSTDDDDGVHWFFTQFGSKDPPIEIFSFGSLIPTYHLDLSNIAVNTSTPKHVMLVIRNVTSRNAGTYECQDDEGYGDKASAELSVIEGLTTCVYAQNTNAITEIRCNYILIGNLAPVLTCVHDGYNQSTESIIESSIENGMSKYIVEKTFFNEIIPMTNNTYCSLAVNKSSTLHIGHVNDNLDVHKSSGVNSMSNLELSWLALLLIVIIPAVGGFAYCVVHGRRNLYPIRQDSPSISPPDSSPVSVVSTPLSNRSNGNNSNSNRELLSIGSLP